jgi:hypothetical protein
MQASIKQRPQYQIQIQQIHIITQQALAAEGALSGITGGVEADGVKTVATEVSDTGTDTAPLIGSAFTELTGVAG